MRIILTQCHLATLALVAADGSLRAIEVVTGRSDGRMTAVRSGDLKPGMKVVTGVKAAAK